MPAVDVRRAIRYAAAMDSIIVSIERRRGDRPDRAGLSREALVLIESTGGRIRSTDRDAIAEFRRGEVGDRRRADRRARERREGREGRSPV